LEKLKRLALRITKEFRENSREVAKSLLKYRQMLAGWQGSTEM
jgi:hypothetical protein